MRVQARDARRMARLVHANGGPVWMTVYADEGHNFWAKSANNNYGFYTWIQFVKQYLLN